MTLTLKGTTSSAVSVTVGAPALDQETVKAKVKAFVDAYNAVVTLARNEMSEKKVASPTSQPTPPRARCSATPASPRCCPSCASQMGEAYTGLGNATTLDDLTDIGISSGKPGASVAQAKSGLLQIDEAKLAAALDADAQGVRRLFGGGRDAAFAQDVEKLVDDLGEMLDGRVETDRQADQRHRRTT